jgi:hypothetical protein
MKTAYPGRKTEDARRPYGNTSSYTPASDANPRPFVPPRDCYSPPATSADPKPEPEDAP